MGVKEQDHLFLKALKKKLGKRFNTCYIKHVMTIQGLLRELISKEKLTVYQVAKAVGVDHGNLYRSLTNGSNLELNTMLKVLDHLGYEIRFVKSKRRGVKESIIHKQERKIKRERK